MTRTLPLRQFRYRPVCFLLAIAAGLLCGGVQAQDPPPAPAVTAPIVEGRMKAVEEDGALDEAAKTRITELYTQALEQLRIADDWESKAIQFEEFRSTAPQMIEQIQQDLSQAPATTLEAPPEEATIAADIEPALAQAESELSSAQSELAELEKESAQRTERRRQIPDLQAATRQRLEEIRAQLSAPSPAGDSAELVEARRLYNEARRYAAEQELRSYEQELLSYDARGRLLTLRIDSARRRVETARLAVEHWRTHLQARRQEEANAAVASVLNPELFLQLEANGAPPGILQIARDVAEDTASLNRVRTGPEGMFGKIEATENRIEETSRRLNTLASEFTTLTTKVEAATGSSTVVGRMLRNHRQNLPDVRVLEQRIYARQKEIADVQILQIDTEDVRREYYDVNDLADDALASLPEDFPEAQRTAIREILIDLYEAKRDALGFVVADYETYFNKLLELDAKERQLITEADTYRNYINERVLWVPSGNPISIGEWPDILQALRWLIARDNLRALLHALFSDLATSPVRVVACLLFVLVLNAFRWHMRRKIAERADEAMKRGCMSIRPTWDAALLSLLVSLGIPLLIALIGWRSAASLASTDYTWAVGTGLMGTAFLLWSLELAREIVRPNGLGIAHFGWSETPCRSIDRQLIVFEWTVVPLLVLVAIFDVQVDQPWQVSLGRLALVLALLGIAVLAHRFMRSRHGAVVDVVERARRRSSLTLRRVWYACAVLPPLVLLAAAAYGYYYSALLITVQLHYTLTAAFGLAILFLIVVRGKLMARRKMSRKRAKQRLDAMRVATTESDAPEPADELDLDKIDTQAMRLIRSAFAISLACCVWMIWADDLPALSVLDRVELWEVSEMVEVAPANGETPAATEQQTEQKVPITLRDAAVFLFLIGITFIAVQNLPGLLEIVVLQRMPLIAGERYAINMIVGYILAIIGVTWALTAIGLSWGRLQWLIAAIGLGLGFGLQEIFANLVSGIIILFERPIRVGDTVTVGEVSGTVSKIRIRATWITAFNRQELIVPNKEFVTGRLINWTLSDQILRIEVPVGIAYGSDTELARRLMLEVANAHPLVLDDPEPVVYFMGFGDSALNFEMRVHSPDLESYLDIKDAMHTGIDAAFRKHGVEIPFPQQDLHVRSIDAALQIKKDEASPPG